MNDATKINWGWDWLSAFFVCVSLSSRYAANYRVDGEAPNQKTEKLAPSAKSGPWKDARHYPP